jgi:hypothetical protein
MNSRALSPTKIDMGALIMQAQFESLSKNKKKMENKFGSNSPRSISKRKKDMQSKLKKLLEQNLRLKATNAMLKENSTQVLGQAIECEQDARSQKMLVVKAHRELAF